MGIIDKCMQHCDCTIHEISRGGVGTQLMRGDVMKTQKALSGALLNTCKTTFILCSGDWGRVLVMEEYCYDNMEAFLNEFLNSYQGRNFQ